MIYRLLAVLLLAGSQATAALADSPSNYETRLLATADAVISGNWARALNTVDKLNADFPLSRIAHLLRADMLSALAGNPSAEKVNPAIADLREQLRLRWRHTNVITPEWRSVPAKLLQVSGAVPFVLYADLPSSRLYVFAQQNGQLVRISDYYITIGEAGFGKEREGDLKTPLGVYQIDSYIPGGQLHSRYGAGALTTDYPNTLDRFLRRTGYGIWLHGTEPGWINRAPRASEGCITLSNMDFEQLVTQLGSHRDIPIVIDDDPNWIPAQQVEQKRNDVIRSIIASTDRATKSPAAEHHKASTIGHAVSGNTVITDLVLYPGRQERLLARWITLENETGVAAFEQYWHRPDGGEWQMTLQTPVPVRSPERFTADVVVPTDSTLNLIGN